MLLVDYVCNLYRPSIGLIYTRIHPIGHGAVHCCLCSAVCCMCQSRRNARVEHHSGGWHRQLFHKSDSCAGEEGLGLIPRCCAYMFSKIEELPPEVEVRMKVSMLEIYNEKFRDLLQPRDHPNQQKLKLKQVLSQSTFSENCRSERSYARILLVSGAVGDVLRS